MTCAIRRRLCDIVVLSVLVAMSAGCGGSPSAAVGPRSPTVAVQPVASATLLPGKPQGKLSERLQQLAEPAVHNQDSASQAEAIGLPASGPGSLLRNERGEVLVVIRLSSASEANVQVLRDLGVTISNVAESFDTVTGYVRLDQLAALADLAIVEYVREELQP